MAWDWGQTGPLVAVLTPLVGVPLAAVTFYLRALREQHTEALTDLARRVDRLETRADALRQGLADAARDSATKEEWIRENLLARDERRRLSEAVTRLHAEQHAAARLSGWATTAVRGFAVLPGANPTRRARSPRRAGTRRAGGTTDQRIKADGQWQDNPDDQTHPQ